jgi:hypothetical protein
MKSIAIINKSSVVTDAQLAVIVAACQIQITRDFAPVWGIDAKLYMAGENQISVPAPQDYQLIILDDSDQAGALGYHDTTEAGLPLGKVFAKSDLASHSIVSATISHELLEMLADPDISRLVEVQHGGKSFVYALEVCDPCEDDKWNYRIDHGSFDDAVACADPRLGIHHNTEHYHYAADSDEEHLCGIEGCPPPIEVEVSDFIYPRWFHNYRVGNVGAPTVHATGEAQSGKSKEPNALPSALSPLRFDHAGHMKEPFQLLEGGYISLSEVKMSWRDQQQRKKTIGGLAQLILEGPTEAPLAYRARPRVGSRRERRRTQRYEWQRSAAAEKSAAD